MGIHQHSNIIHSKPERGSVEPEVSCSAHKLLEVGDRIGQLVEEKYLKLLEERDGDSRKERFQVSTGTVERKPTETRKCDAHRDWRTQQLPLTVTAGKMGVREDP